jgi:hypothetical protein
MLAIVTPRDSIIPMLIGLEVPAVSVYNKTKLFGVPREVPLIKEPLNEPAAVAYVNTLIESFDMHKRELIIPLLEPALSKTIEG